MVSSGHPGVGRQQDLSSLELAGCMLATAEQRPKLRSAQASLSSTR